MEPLEYKITRKSLTSKTMHVVNSEKIVEFVKESNADGSDKVLRDGFSNEVVWRLDFHANEPRLRTYVNSNIFTRIELNKRNNHGQGRFTFYWCGEKYRWVHYNYAGHNFKCIHVLSNEVVADFHYATWALLDLGKLKIQPQQHPWSCGFREYLMFSAIDLVEDSLVNYSRLPPQESTRQSRRHLYSQELMPNTSTDLESSAMLVKC
ncbi:hypothetical protein IWQ61_005841 [Dispira simplex]|nr:hypothetical protein IWQ61_005841 [Dispira simplex]